MYALVWNQNLNSKSMPYQGRQSLVGCQLWGHTESDMTEVA